MRWMSEDLLGGLVLLVNLLFLAKLVIYIGVIHWFSVTRDQWLSIFDRVGGMDAAIAVASFLESHPAHVRPQVAGEVAGKSGSEPAREQVIELQQGYHPLLTDPVKVSFCLAGRSALVTGSNMTGKTTFIKTVALNIILGHTLGICLADRATLPRSPVRAVIHAPQGVAGGRSRYFAESEALLGFLAEAASGGCRVFVIDEPFSGTNTTERIAIAKAVLRSLGAQAQLLVTTHDVELQHLLGEGFAMYHFREDPAVEGFFDHRLYPGVGRQRNAIRVLERMGFPPGIIAEALAAAAANTADPASQDLRGSARG